MTFPTRPDFEFERGYWSATTTNVYWICGICHDTVCHLYFDEIKMAYEYNPKAYYALYGKHRELIAAGDLGKLEIVVRDDNEKGESFSALDIRRIEYIRRVRETSNTTRWNCGSWILPFTVPRADSESLQNIWMQRGRLLGLCTGFTPITTFHVDRTHQLVAVDHGLESWFNEAWNWEDRW